MSGGLEDIFRGARGATLHEAWFATVGLGELRRQTEDSQFGLSQIARRDRSVVRIDLGIGQVCLGPSDDLRILLRATHFGSHSGLILSSHSLLAVDVVVHDTLVETSSSQLRIAISGQFTLGIELSGESREVETLFAQGLLRVLASLIGVGIGRISLGIILSLTTHLGFEFSIRLRHVLYGLELLGEPLRARYVTTSFQQVFARVGSTIHQRNHLVIMPFRGNFRGTRDYNGIDISHTFSLSSR